MACSIISTRLAVAIAMAPPEPPSPRISARLGTPRLRQASVERALQRLEKEPDDFGLCRMCEDEIAEKRLLAMPFVELCVDCQANRDPSRGGARKHLTDYKG